MHNVRVHLTAPAADATAAFAALTDLPGLPERTPAVLSVESHRSTEDGSLLSNWQVLFGAGRLHWTEQDDIRPDERRFGFKVVGGDIPTFAGSWQVLPEIVGASAIFEAHFDFEMPQLADTLAPLAADAIIANAIAILTSVLGPDASIVASGHAPSPAVTP